jgi:putative transposase
VNQAHTEAELEALRYSVRRGALFGSPAWQETTAEKLQLQFTLHPRGRPKKPSQHEPAPEK